MYKKGFTVSDVARVPSIFGNTLFIAQLSWERLMVFAVFNIEVSDTNHLNCNYTVLREQNNVLGSIFIFSELELLLFTCI